MLIGDAHGQCLTENTLHELVAGRLPADALAHAREHVERCASCRALAVELARDGHAPSCSTAATEPRTAAPATDDFEIVARNLTPRFEILRPLGGGGMGVVYAALDRERGIPVALKTLRHISPDHLLRFKNEFRALQDVTHPNLVTLGELIEGQGQWWLTMELIEGEDIVAHVRPGGRLDEGRLRTAMVQLVSALQALHARGLVHRDIKPHNVLVTHAGRVVLLDFGLVAQVDQSESDVVGTAAYMAPEQARGHEVGPAADWYGVGALLYEALTGKSPFHGPALQVLMAKQNELPRRPGEIADVPADLEALCMELLATEPAARPDGAAVLARLAPIAPPTPAPAGLTPAAVFVGRRRELRTLADAFSEARAGRDVIVLIQGESGIGKSALMRRFTNSLRQREPSVVVLAGRCYERETVPYKALDGVVDALARYLRRLPSSELAIVLPRRAGLLGQVFPVLRKIPALVSLSVTEVLDPKELRTRAFAVLRELLGRLAEYVPLIVCIDDLQWADAESLELLHAIMAPPEAPALLLMMSSRPSRFGESDHDVEAGMARLRASSRMRLLELERLPREEAIELAGHLLARHPALAGADASSVALEAEGHPLFMELVVGYKSRGPAARPGMHLSEALWAHIEALDLPARRLLALVAVAGWPLSPEIITATAALPASELDATIARLRHASLVRFTDSSRHGTIEPYHGRVREAVLEHLAPETRQECHRLLAHALLRVGAAGEVPLDAPESSSRAAQQLPDVDSRSWGAETVAVHLHGAGDLEQAARYMALAADQASAALAFDRAVRLYRQALELHARAGEPLDTREILGRLVQALVHASRGSEAAAVYLQLAQMARTTTEERLRLQLSAAEQLLRFGHKEEGARVLDPVLTELGIHRRTTRLGALWSLLWRRAWLRVRGFGY
ncbi:MAG TPA: protein kinase, partial [Haliangium sp.]|nr:protein kinase [Haliangium sp.]